MRVNLELLKLIAASTLPKLQTPLTIRRVTARVHFHSQSIDVVGRQFGLLFQQSFLTPMMALSLSSGNQIKQGASLKRIATHKYQTERGLRKCVCVCARVCVDCNCSVARVCWVWAVSVAGVCVRVARACLCFVGVCVLRSRVRVRVLCCVALLLVALCVCLSVCLSVLARLCLRVRVCVFVFCVFV